jgi:hypothetical protein
VAVIEEGLADSLLAVQVAPHSRHVCTTGLALKVKDCGMSSGCNNLGTLCSTAWWIDSICQDVRASWKLQLRCLAMCAHKRSLGMSEGLQRTKSRKH